MKNASISLYFEWAKKNRQALTKKFARFYRELAVSS